MTMRVYQCDDEQFYAARTQAEAVAEFESEWGKAPEEVVELSDAQLDEFTVTREGENEEADEKVTFREQLQEDTGGEDRDAFLLCCSNY